MWIRGQDRKDLTDITGKYVDVFKNKIGVDLHMSPDIKSHWLTLGEYETEKDAIKVMDMIQDSLNRGVYTFNMPTTEQLKRERQR